MLFAARIYFDFTDPAVWRLYRFLVAAEKAGAELRTDWRSFGAGPSSSARALGSYEAVRASDPDRHGAYLQAMLVARHMSGEEPGHPSVQAGAAAAAGVDPGVVADPDRFEGAVAESTAEGRRLGVTAVPSLYRHGPVAHVSLTAASETGDVLRRLATIDAFLEDDGIWEVSKP